MKEKIKNILINLSHKSFFEWVLFLYGGFLLYYVLFDQTPLLTELYEIEHFLKSLKEK